MIRRCRLKRLPCPPAFVATAWWIPLYRSWGATFLRCSGARLIWRSGPRALRVFSTLAFNLGWLPAQPAWPGLLRRAPPDHQLDLALHAGLTIWFRRHDQTARADRHDDHLWRCMCWPRLFHRLSGDGLGLAPILRLFECFERWFCVPWCSPIRSSSLCWCWNSSPSATYLIVGTWFNQSLWW